MTNPTRSEKIETALRAIAEMPCAEQDNMPAFNMRRIAREAIATPTAGAEPVAQGRTSVAETERIRCYAVVAREREEWMESNQSAESAFESGGVAALDLVLESIKALEDVDAPTPPAPAGIAEIERLINFYGAAEFNAGDGEHRYNSDKRLAELEDKRRLGKDALLSAIKRAIGNGKAA